MNKVKHYISIYAIATFVNGDRAFALGHEEGRLPFPAGALSLSVVSACKNVLSVELPSLYLRLIDMR